jgi:FtsZ-binding cell division protein ZapB
VEGLREQLALLKGERDDLRRRLDRADEERRQAQERLTALLTDDRPKRRWRFW